jgi:ferritin
MKLQASHTYLSLANYYAHDTEALLGFSKIFKQTWKEKSERAEKIRNYITKRGGNIGLFSYLFLRFLIL